MDVITSGLTYSKILHNLFLQSIRSITEKTGRGYGDQLNTPHTLIKNCMQMEPYIH